jgi:hypothetical protein
MRKALVITALLVFSMTLTALPLVSADGNVVDIKVHLSGEPVLGITGTSTYHGTLLDTKNRDWTYEIYVTSAAEVNITGAAPSEETPAKGNLSATNKTLSFDVTAPLEPGDLTVNINISSPSGEDWYTTTETIKVVRPVVISATIDNPTNTEVSNATVRFYVDNEQIDTQTIESIPVGDSADISSEWILEDVPTGWHDTRIEIDLDNDANPEWTLHDRFYVEGGGALVLYITILAGLIAMLAGIYLIAKRKLK